jgi:hypothetical protein
VIHRATQTSEYWYGYQLNSEDLEFASTLILESTSPKSSLDLALAIINRRVELENVRIRREIDRSSIYQPKKQFTVGEELLFPSLNFIAGKVIEIRKGITPGNVEFEVIKIELRDGTRREFASHYGDEHKLNDDGLVSRLLNQQTDLRSPQLLFDLYGDRVAKVLDITLDNNPDFIKIGKEWFLRAMMADVNVGHLNLAEAVLEMAGGGPLPTHIILRDLGLPPEVARALQEVALNNALAVDDRFDEVSMTDKPAWFLKRLEPRQVREIPVLIRGEVNTIDMPKPPLDQLMVELDDELDNVSPAHNEHDKVVTTILIAPHRRAGTLGWGGRFDCVFPDFNKPRLPITLRDKMTGKTFTTWLVREGRYIWGMADWYKTFDLPVGAAIHIWRGDEPHIFFIDCKRHRPKRDWVRVASVRDGRLRLETAQRATTCDADDLMSIYADDLKIFDMVRVGQTRDLNLIVREVFPEIAKLSPQGNVHARTLYAVVNLLLRAAPRDVFNALCSNNMFVPVGDNYWHMSERN